MMKPFSLAEFYLHLERAKLLNISKKDFDCEISIDVLHSVCKILMKNYMFTLSQTPLAYQIKTVNR